MPVDTPAPRSLALPGSKSITARALFLAAAADGVTTLVHPLRSDDTEGFAEGLVRLGYRVGRTPDTWQVDGRPQGPALAEADVYCRDGATTARFLPTLAAAGHGTYRFDASPQMRRRPLLPLSRALRDLGVDLRHEEAEGHHPLTVRAAGVDGGDVVLDAGQSSQYLTALLLLGPLTRRGLRIRVTDLVSAPYVGITLAMMRAFGVEVAREGDVFVVPPGGYRATTYAIEPDASTASYFFAAAALTPGAAVTVPGLGTGALQGDLGFVDVLRRMGADVSVGAGATTVRGTGELRGLTVTMRDISDTMPTLAAIAPFASAPVRIEDVANTRVKECDRLEACAENLRRLGVRVSTGPDWIEIHPGTAASAGTEIRTYGDHRIVMSFAVTGLRVPGISFDDPGCVRKTFPGFHEAFAEWRRSNGS
ncbi:3-phosphoshikimate 1-carboxyvinyltransferase [Streptomyces sp. SAI-208]|uniref:3-phosphoshikimate 1-carboxyvinyltransferase n=1 Tax=unclassified Streptomyces TaxID=2593676 RepID=UPI00247450FE|nr:MULTISPECIES: 3-phosphoshikimate 1-carboxyvinyltransferase [unclassified Streptomyces]MDH6518907.1 3-phosphoshikimate 1-carboxyvinyltransferase [Streptomyces sp. SAI-090]MDH6551128.1 3-phosphoshikimate 1-carboxyvinyltransferase [Streptomyces sp. SAI-041]MDH6570191.1 3-phosphoshikimate 1-carboxyvinyltransferase [Streptomyces sp. SAI-117]MDH6584836.1 3-phosphoshikimate 1-carboxyvinyltransferase [Streptomyces sp. SAI-133]MDH6609753.1 3-phosphoshikimate 1-carboxyvinyltransferase [Streptomyces s